jgi:hypothetical protein
MNNDKKEILYFDFSFNIYLFFFIKHVYIEIYLRAIST